jgi:hypothetical protein
MNTNSHRQTSEIASIRASKQPPFAADEKDVKRSWPAEAAAIGMLYASYGFELPYTLPSPFRLGYDVAACVGVQVSAEFDEFDHEWLELRVEAWRDRRVLELDVTPNSLRAISRGICPITDLPLTSGTGEETDMVYVRLCPEGDYSLANLGVLSAPAAVAKGDKSFADLQELADLPGVHEGLTQYQWRRLVAYVARVEHVRRGQDISVPQCARQAPGSSFSMLAFLQVAVIGVLGLPAEVLDRLHATLSPESAECLADIREFWSEQTAYGSDGYDTWLDESTLQLFGLFYEVLEVAERQRHELVWGSFKVSAGTGVQRAEELVLDSLLGRSMKTH